DPKKATFYKQSDIPEIPMLAWVLSCFTPVGTLLRAHSFVEALQKEGGGSAEDRRKEIREALGTKGGPQLEEHKELAVNHGVLAYPVLMAADILLFDTDVVPVGKDQKQHLEIA